KNPVSTGSSLRINSISPSTGGPGTIVTIQGQGFGTVQGSSLVSYAGVTLTPHSWSDTVIVAPIPLNNTVNGAFVVTIGGNSSNPSAQFSVSDPILSGITPPSGTPGTQVTLTGQFFGVTQNGSYVSFNGQVSQVINWSSNVINCVVPTSGGLSPGNLSVVVMVNGNRPSNSLSFSLIFPSISGINPSSDNVGSVITINGQGFGASQNQVGGVVTIGGLMASVNFWSDYSIQARVPQVPNPAVYNVMVTSNQKQSTPFPFTISSPELAGILPNPLKRGELLTINGKYFGQTQSEGPGSVTIDGFPASIQGWQDNQIRVIVPNGASTGSNKTVLVNVGGLEGFRSDLQINLIF
ncbi:IPT/TIG domain-containing protein, partial [bacterium]|nr:IPT/TIG domain-containing protein [bacterium]